MQTAIASFLVRVLLGYVRKHPQAIYAVVHEVEKAIPGKVDDALLESLVKLLLAL
jgi:hypothetical protein